MALSAIRSGVARDIKAVRRLLWVGDICCARIEIAFTFGDRICARVEAAFSPPVEEPTPTKKGASCVDGFGCVLRCAIFGRFVNSPMRTT